MPMKLTEIIALGNLAVNVIRLIVDIIKKDNKKDRF
jgi:hypothetical protein